MLSIKLFDIRCVVLINFCTKLELNFSKRYTVEVLDSRVSTSEVKISVKDIIL